MIIMLMLTMMLIWDRMVQWVVSSIGSADAEVRFPAGVNLYPGDAADSPAFLSHGTPWHIAQCDKP